MEGKRCALYRHFAADGELLYVGISLRPFTRIRDHIRVSSWADTIANITFEYFDSRVAAMAAEARAVQEENPRHNVRLRKPKKLPKAAMATQVKADAARVELTQRVQKFELLYKPSDAAAALGIGTGTLNREIASGNLAVVLLPSTKEGKMNRYITGWQIIDWLESRESTAGVGASNGG
jgi:hypothetical protein